MQNKRANLRVELPIPVRASLEAEEIIEIWVLDIGAAGAKFVTPKDLDIGTVAILVLTLEERLTMVGEIIRKETLDYGIQYGFKSLSDELEKTPWIKAVNTLVSKRKK